MDFFFNADISHAWLTLSTDNWQTSTNGHLSTMATSLQRPFFLADSQTLTLVLNLSTTTTIFCPKRGCCAEVQLLFRSCRVYNQLCWSKICNFHLLLSSHPARCPLMYLAKNIVVLCCSSGIQNLGFLETDHPPIPKSTLSLTSHLGQNVGLGEG